MHVSQGAWLKCSDGFERHHVLSDSFPQRHHRALRDCETNDIRLKRKRSSGYTDDPFDKSRDTFSTRLSLSNLRRCLLGPQKPPKCPKIILHLRGESSNQRKQGNPKAARGFNPTSRSRDPQIINVPLSIKPLVLATCPS